MEYRRLGRSGLKVSVLSFGSWVTFGNANQLETANQAAECLTAAKEAGVNFFDNAEGYAAGESERVMGQAFRDLGWQRHEYVVSTKLFWGLHDQVNMRNTLNRKYLSQAIDGSLERFGLDFVDLVFCHRPDRHTPIEETVWAMSDMITQGKALYWGTSEWSADEIRAAYDVADRHHLHKPLMEQPQYNILWRDRVEKEYRRLYEDIGLGTTIWSPLASGLLTGKYLNGVPEGSRATLPGYEWLRSSLTDPKQNAKVAALKEITDELGVSLTQFSLAWCAKNPHVSTVITGASSAAQVRENMGALDVMPLITPEVMERVDLISLM
ncbi:MAG: aldo/keto reductase [Acidobacteriota bacterium]|nr:aldo/keto reductase [Acidobacteriota bacterium]MDE3044070.1 aldo/keto reductase [Acidobacteriota bacterium]MDE3107720.1 aldo/keto reductase [Acidobacteriota bacterium]MDE3222831.1 aldo/keto reductase [Acidobacteriota bacterium]